MKQVTKKLKDKKIKIFSIDNDAKKRLYLMNDLVIASFWAYFLSISGKEFANVNADTIKRQASFTINYNSNVKEGMYIEYNNEIYRIAFVSNGEDYKGSDLVLSVITSKDAEGIV